MSQTLLYATSHFARSKNKIHSMRRAWNRLFDLTGFRGKTLWDLLGLLIVPLFIAGATLVFSISELRREEQRVQDTILRSYMQDMTELLLDKWLVRSEFHAPIRKIARSSTIATVRQLDGNRKGILLQFLYESNLISHSDDHQLLIIQSLS